MVFGVASEFGRKVALAATSTGCVPARHTLHPILKRLLGVAGGFINSPRRSPSRGNVRCERQGDEPMCQPTRRGFPRPVLQLLRAARGLGNGPPCVGVRLHFQKCSLSRKDFTTTINPRRLGPCSFAVARRTACLCSSMRTGGTWVRTACANADTRFGQLGLHTEDRLKSAVAGSAACAQPRRAVP